jgi:LPS-assembly lipoprotein
MSAVKATNSAIVRARIGFVLAAASLVAGCGFQPLYGRNPSSGDESVRDRFAEVLVAPIPSKQGSAQQRVAVAIHNALEFDLNNGATPVSPTYRLTVTIAPTDVTVTIDPTSGRPIEEIGGVKVSYQLIEIGTGKVVVKDGTFANVGYDAPGPGQQRFAKQRAQIDAQDRAAKVAAEAIRNRLASYFVAGT